jgi:hypothetical protein
VHAAADGELVGVCWIGSIDHHFRRAELGIFLGVRRGTGIGTDAVRLPLDWAFNMLGLHNVMLETYEFNEQARRALDDRRPKQAPDVAHPLENQPLALGEGPRKAEARRLLADRRAFAVDQL